MNEDANSGRAEEIREDSVAITDRGGVGCRSLTCGTRLCWGAPRWRGLGESMHPLGTPAVQGAARCQQRGVKPLR